MKFVEQLRLRFGASFALLLMCAGLVVNVSLAQTSPPPTTPPTTIPTDAPTISPTSSPLTTFEDVDENEITVIPIQAGSVEGLISDSAPRVRYRFDGQSDQGVTIRMEMRSGNLDPFLNLYDANGALVASNDDQASGNRNALIALTLPRTGAYTIEATRYSQGETLTTGSYQLTLTISGGQATPDPDDILTTPPNFGVVFDPLTYSEISVSDIRLEGQTRYFAFAGQQGDFVRVIMRRTTGDLVPSLRILNRERVEIGREAQMDAAESTALATLPETGWYLIEAQGREGGGDFEIFVTRLANAVLQIGEPVQAAFSSETPTLSYIINARIGDVITATMFSTDAAAGIAPQLELSDTRLRPIANETGDRFVTMRATIPRSGSYILTTSNLAEGTMGGFSLRVSNVPANAGRLNATNVNYNEQYKGNVTPESTLHYYRFNGKMGELVTIGLSASIGSELDPYLILMDSDLNELAANEDTTLSTNARITQFRLPKDGDYVILASRSGLNNGRTFGEYTLTITAGAVRLTNGALSATLQWSGDADLNLFVRDPALRTVSWSNPSTPSGGSLQIDSNTNCETPSAEPVEHIFWRGDQAPIGDYTVWAWYQNGCGRDAPVTLTLTLRLGEDVLLTSEQVLNAGERLEASMRVGTSGDGFIVNVGAITLPSPQQTASEGGDSLLRYGDQASNTLDDAIYARFYQFYGTQGDQVRIRMNADIYSTLDPIIVLRDFNDELLPNGMNDDANNSTRNAELLYTLPYTGQYLIGATRYGVQYGTTYGRYQLRLEVIENAP